MNESSDWQLKNEKLSERGKYLLDSGLWSDCKFIVGIEPNTRVRLIFKKNVTSFKDLHFNYIFFQNT